jgi:hypothetical protein
VLSGESNPGLKVDSNHDYVSELRFGGDEAAFAGGIEDGGAVALEVGLSAAQGGDSGV